jgi:hypothetical protein
MSDFNMNEWPCCLKERGAEVGCSRETVVIDGDEYDLIGYGEGDRAKNYEEMIESYNDQIENGGRGRLTAEDVRQEKQSFIEDTDPETFNNRTCHDCAAPMGEIHHLGCDMEECPKCGGQYFVCDCRTAEKEELWAE